VVGCADVKTRVREQRNWAEGFSADARLGGNGLINGIDKPERIIYGRVYLRNSSHNRHQAIP
jgi:hypothetical protein